MARYHGKKGYMYVSTTGSGNAVPVILTEWSLDMTTDKVETTSLQDSNKTYVQGLKDVNGSFRGMWDDTDETLFTASESSDGAKVYLYPSSDAATKYFYGPAWLDASVALTVSGPVTISGSFAANGAWGRK